MNNFKNHKEFLPQNDICIFIVETNLLSYKRATDNFFVQILSNEHKYSKLSEAINMREETVVFQR